MNESIKQSEKKVVDGVIYTGGQVPPVKKVTEVKHKLKKGGANDPATN